MTETNAIQVTTLKDQKKSNAAIKNLSKLSLKLLAITIIRKITILEIVLSQKTNNNLNNLYIGNYQVRSFIIYAEYPISNSFP